MAEPSWELWRSFLAVVRAGSLSAAARRLRVAQPTLGRHVEELEAALGIPLFTRSRAGLAPTPAALRLVPLAEAMDASAAALIRAAAPADEDGQAAGTVRVAASEVMGVEVLPPILAAMQRRHPRIVVELALSSRTEDLLRRDADVAVRMVRPEQKAVLARKVGAVGLGFYARRDHVEAHGAPAGPEDLRGRRLVGFDRDDTSARAVAADRLPVDRGMFTFRTDSDLAQLAAIRSGAGIGVMQDRIAARDPDLVRVMPGFGFTLGVWVAMHEDRRGDRTVRAAFDALVEGLAGWVTA